MNGKSVNASLSRPARKLCVHRPHDTEGRDGLTSLGTSISCWCLDKHNFLKSCTFAVSLHWVVGFTGRKDQKNVFQLNNMRIQYHRNTACCENSALQGVLVAGGH